MISSIISRIVILVFGTLYPAYASYKAVRTKNVKEYVKWMMYWIVFALFTCAETITDVFFSWFPFYYEVKILLVIWLLSPATKGSSILYRKFVHPALCRREQEIDEYISKAKDQGYHTVLNLGTKGVNYATNVIMQTAIKGGGGLVQQLRRSYSLSDLSVSDDHIDSRSQQELDEAEDLVLTDPRLVRRSTVGGRGRNPRPHSSPRVDMIFPEVDLLSHNRAVSGGRDKFSHIRSSEDISSAYVPEGAIGPDGLLRTASVGGSTRTRSKVTRSTFTSIKRPGAAEDEEVFIEEMEDGSDPSEFLRNILPIPQDDGTVCLPYSKDILSQYLRFIMNSEVQGRKKEVDDGDAEYKQYLKLKEVYDSDSSQDAVKLRCITPSDPGKLESKQEDITPTDQEKIPISNPPVVNATPKILEHKSIDKKVDSEPTKKTDNILVLDDKSKQVVLEETKKAVEETSSKLAGSPTSNAFVDKQDKISPKEGHQNIGTRDIENPKKVVEEATTQSPTNSLTPDARVDKLDKISEESRSIGASSSNLSSDDETGEGEFTTPNSSPIMKNKINRSGKNKKRHAPPPPVCHSSSPSDKNDAENPDKQQNDAKPDTKSSITFTLGESPLNYGSLVDLSPTVSVTSDRKRSESSISSQSPLKRKQRTKSRSSVKESPLSKLIHLPAKFAFWNTGEDGKASGSDNEESNDSVHDNSSLSDYGSTSNVRNWKGEQQPSDGEVPATTTLSKLKLDIDEDHFVDAENGSSTSAPPKVVSGSPTPNDKLEEKKDKKDKEEEKPKVKVGNVQAKPEPDNVTFIPLKIETLMMHTESKSTDV